MRPTAPDPAMCSGSTDAIPADPSLYHLVVDATVLSVEDLVEVLALAAEAFWRQGS